MYIGVLGGLVSVAFGLIGSSTPNASDLARWAKAAGLLFSIAFLLIEMSIEQYLQHFQRILKQLEERLGYSQMTTRPRLVGFVRAYHITYTLYGCVILFWATAVLREL